MNTVIMVNRYRSSSPVCYITDLINNVWSTNKQHRPRAAVGCNEEMPSGMTYNMRTDAPETLCLRNISPQGQVLITKLNLDLSIRKYWCFSHLPVKTPIKMSHLALWVFG